MKKIILPLLCFTLCACSSEGKNEPQANKVSFEEAKQFILSHPTEKYETDSTDLYGVGRDGFLPSFKSYGSSCTIKVTENVNQLHLDSKLYYKFTYHFDYNEKFAFAKMENSDEHSTHKSYQYMHILNDNEYELITARIDLNVLSIDKETKQIPESEKNNLVDQMLYQFRCPINTRALNYCLVNFVEDYNGEVTEEEFSKNVDFYEFYIENDTLLAKTKIKCIADKNGHLIKGKETDRETDEIVTFSCDYTINSKGVCTNGKYSCPYHGDEFLGYKVESIVLDETLYNNDFNELNQLVQQHE